MQLKLGFTSLSQGIAELLILYWYYKVQNDILSYSRRPFRPDTLVAADVVTTRMVTLQMVVHLKLAVPLRLVVPHLLLLHPEILHLDLHFLLDLGWIESAFLRYLHLH
jgi:hypothetical protein